MKSKGGVSRTRETACIRIAALACALAGLCAVLSACGLHGPQGKQCGTEVPDPDDKFVMKGCVENADGGPAIGARVIAWPHSDAELQAGLDSSLISKDTVLTDAMGGFAFGKRLAPGRYDLFFEDSSAKAAERPVKRLQKADHGPGRLILPTVRLTPPAMLVLAVKDKNTQDSIPGATCEILQAPYRAVTGSQGVAVFFLPEGLYQVKCTAAPPRNDNLVEVELKADSSLQQVLYLSENAPPPQSLPPPADVKMAYDLNSGVVTLSWSPLLDTRLFKYGIRKFDLSKGAVLEEFSTTNTYFVDAPFNPADSLQKKNLYYGVFSLMRDPGGFTGPGQSMNRKVIRPLAYGPRIDTLYPLKPDSLKYRVGDTIPFVASWSNAVRGNDSLIWRLAGGTEPLRVVERPPDAGMDTLYFVLPKAGTFEIGMLMRDSEGYRSWISRSFTGM